MYYLAVQYWVRTMSYGSSESTFLTSVFIRNTDQRWHHHSKCTSTPSTTTTYNKIWSFTESYLFRTVLWISWIFLFHEGPAQPHHLGQEDGVRVQVGAKTVQHLKDGRVEVEEGGAGLEKDRGGGRGGGRGASSSCGARRVATSSLIP